jgi:hypothetical protein
MQYDAAWQELRQRAGAGRREPAGGVTRQQMAGAGSRTASAENNVVPYPTRHYPQPSQVHESQPSADPQHSQGPHALAAPQSGLVGRGQAPAAMEWTALEPLVKAAIASASATHAWYDKRASHVKNLSRLSRLFAIWLGVLGGVCPLLPASLFAPLLEYFPASGATATGSGLVFFAIAGGCLLLDQAFGFSSSWMRYRLAELRLGKLIRTFAVEVESELAKCGGKSLPSDRAESILARLNAFVAEVENRKIEETESWVAEFKAGLLHIEQFAKGRGKSAAGEK